MFNTQRHGLRRAGRRRSRSSRAFVFWFNGNGIPERYWIPSRDRARTSSSRRVWRRSSRCATIFTSSAASTMPGARSSGPGNTHHKSMSGAGVGHARTPAAAPAARRSTRSSPAAMGGRPRFRSLQVGVCQESHGENIHRNMSWAGTDRALPPEMIPQNLFDRLFGVRDESWVEPEEERARCGPRGSGDLQPSLGQADRHRLDEHLTSVRDLERAIASLPSDYGKNIKEPEDVADLTDYPRIAKIQSDLVGACAGLGADARRVLHAHEVPEPHAVPVARLHASAAPRLHAHQCGLAGSSADHARHLPVARRGVRLLPEEDEGGAGRRRESARQHLRRCSRTSTPRRTRTRTTAWR